MSTSSGGFGLKSLTGKAKGMAGKAKDKAATAALMGSMGSMNPLGSMGSMGSLFGSKKGKKGSTPDLLSMATGAMSLQPGAPGAQGAPGATKKGNILTTGLKIIIFTVATLFIGLFMVFTVKKNQNFTTDNIIKVVLVALLFNAGMIGAFLMKADILDFLISSQINILCFYMILTYTTLTTLFSNGIFNALKTSFNFIKDIRKDPTSIFENGGKTFIPIFFFVIPTIVILYNATQSMMQFLIILALTVGAGAIILSPKFY